MEMLNMAVQLPKYGNTKLAVGDVIDNWKKKTENKQPIDWAEFQRAFMIMVRSDKELVKKAYTELTGFEDMLTAGNRERIDRFVIDRLCERNSEAFYQRQLETEQAKNDALRELVQGNEELTELQEQWIKARAGELYELIYEDLLKNLMPVFFKYKNTGEIEDVIAKFIKELDIDKYIKQLSLIKKYS